MNIFRYGLTLIMTTMQWKPLREEQRICPNYSGDNGEDTYDITMTKTLNNDKK